MILWFCSWQAGTAGLIFLCLGKDIQETGMLAKLPIMPTIPILRRAAFQKIFFPEYIPFTDFLEDNLVRDAFKILSNVHVSCLRKSMFSASQYVFLFTFLRSRVYAFKREFSYFWTWNEPVACPICPPECHRAEGSASQRATDLPQCAYSLVVGVFMEIYVFAQNHGDVEKLAWSLSTLSIYRWGIGDSKNTSVLPTCSYLFKATGGMRTQGLYLPSGLLSSDRSLTSSEKSL